MSSRRDEPQIDEHGELHTRADLKATEEQYRSLVEHSPDAILLVRNGCIEFANPAAISMFTSNLDEASLAGLDLMVVVGSNSAGFVRRMMASIRKASNPLRASGIEARRLDGEVFSADIIAVPMKGEPRRVQIICRDVTDSKASHNALFESEAQYKALFSHHPSPMWLLERDGNRFVDVNEATLVKYGYERNEFLTLSPESLCADDRSVAVSAAQLALAGKNTEAVGGLLQHRTKHGELIEVEITTQILPLHGRNVFLVTMNDITEARRVQHIEDALLRYERLEVAGELAADLSHEVAQPLNTILMLTHVISQHPSVKADRALAKNVRIMEEQGARAHDTMHGALQNLRNEAPREVLTLNDIVHSVLRISSRLLGQGAVALRLDLDEDLKPNMVRRYSVENVLRNLVKNAVEAMDGFGAQVLTISTRQNSDNTSSLAVTDTGSGIPDSVMPHLFTRFFTTKGAKGTGIGLPVCHRTAVEHDGRLEATNMPEGGARFTLTLPNTTQEPARPVAEDLAIATALNETRLFADAASILGTTGIVMLDDDIALLEATATALKSATGATVMTTSDPYKALELVHTRAPDVFIVDVMMPGMSGVEVWERLGQFDGAGMQRRTIFMSASKSDAPDAMRALATGQPFLNKPCSLRTLIMAVAKLVNSERERDLPPSRAQPEFE